MIEDYMQHVAESEPPAIFHRWCFLSCTSAALARNVYIPFGGGYIYPNMYVALVGAPGTRKSTAINRCKSLLEGGGFTNFSATKTSKQKFLLDWEASIHSTGAESFLDELASVDPVNNILIASDELLDFLGQGNIDFINLLTTLWDNLPLYEERLKNSKSTKIEKPTVNILGGLTPTGLQMALPPESAGTGMMSRMLFVYSESTRRKVAWPHIPSHEERKPFVEYFKRIRGLSGEMKVTPEARELLADIYTDWEQLEDSRLQYYGGRRHTHLLKLCLVVAAMRDTGKQITADVAIEANTILTYTEAVMHLALGEFGKSKYSDAAQAIVAHLEEARGPTSAQVLFKLVSRSVDKFNDFAEVLKTLVRSDRIQCVGTSYIAKKRNVKVNTSYVDFAKYIPENPRNEHAILQRMELPPEALMPPEGEKDEAGW